MSKGKITLFIDIVSPFAYIAFYALQVSAWLAGRCGSSCTSCRWSDATYVNLREWLQLYTLELASRLGCICFGALARLHVC